MIIYKRNIEKRLLHLRLSFCVLGTICAFAFICHHHNLGYFTAVVFMALGIIVVKDFIVYTDSFQISKFYFFGLIKRSWHFHEGENIKASSFGSDFGEDGEIPDIEDTGYHLGCLYSIFAIFASKKITKKEFKIAKRGETNDVISRVRLVIDKTEFDYLYTFIRRSQSS